MRKGLLLLVLVLLSNYVFSSQIPVRNDYFKIIDQQSSVKSQGQRGTCTMFSAIGMIEHLLIRDGVLSKEEADLSEEWMEYIIMKDKHTEGSSTSKNLKAVLEYGVTFEKTWPYLGKKWPDLQTSPMASARCSHLDDLLLQSCLLGHRDPRLLSYSDSELEQIDPEFVTIKNEASLNKEELIKGLYRYKKSYKLKYIESVKRLLNKNKPVIMGTKLYYGSWNSSKTTKLVIQKRDKSKWYAGIVSYPEPNTRDREISFEKGGGHSVIIVGYDDEVEVTSKMLMKDGTWKEFTYKGVYYFKNSWGVRGFGKRFVLDGKALPGYGMITQKYAHEFGNFFNIH